MPVACAVIIGILMSPFTVAFLATMGVLYLASVMFHGAKMPLDYIRGMIKEDGKNVYHATQAVIYFCGMPVLVLCYCLLSLLTVTFYTFYFLAVVFGYFASIDGIQFQPILNHENKDVEYSTKHYSTGNVVAFIVIGIVLILLAVVRFTNYYELFGNNRNLVMGIYYASYFAPMIYAAFVTIYSAIAFRKVAVVAPVAEEKEAK